MEFKKVFFIEKKYFSSKQKLSPSRLLWQTVMRLVSHVTHFISGRKFFCLWQKKRLNWFGLIFKTGVTLQMTTDGTALQHPLTQWCADLWSPSHSFCLENRRKSATNSSKNSSNRLSKTALFSKMVYFWTRGRKEVGSEEEATTSSAISSPTPAV